MGLRNAGDDDHVYVGVLQRLVDAAVGFGARVVLLGIVVRLGRALDDAVNLVDIWKSSNERDVEDFGTFDSVSI